MGANRGYFYTRLYGPHHLWAGSGKDQGSEGSKGEGREGSKQGVKGSKSISILGFRVPTIYGRKNFDDHI